MISVPATIQCDYEDCENKRQITMFYRGNHSKKWVFESVAGWDVSPYGGQTTCPKHNGRKTF